MRLAPLFELLLELHEPLIVFVPTLDIEEQGNFFRFVVSLTEDISKMGEIMPRVLKNFTVENYYTDICEDMDTLDLISTTLNRLNEAIDLAYEYIKKFEEYSYLWLENRQEFLRQFLLFGRALTPDEMELLKDETGPGMKETPPTIKQFKEQIDFYEDLYKKLESFDTEKIIKYWLRIDVRPLRQAVLNTVCKWGNLFKQHLVERVMTSIEELENFIVEATAAMQVELTDDDYDGLLKVMGYLMKVKDRQDTTDLMFEPLKEIIDLLRNYGVEFPEEIHVQLQELPDKWNNCKKVALTTKQTVAPLQANQVNAIRRRIQLFDIRQSMYRDQFKKLPLFLGSCKNVYRLLDKTNKELAELEDDMAKIAEQANLFELTVPEFKQLKAARKEIKQIKQLWDYVKIAMSCIDEWKETLWKKIDVEGMEMECKKYGKELRAMDKELRAWDVYTQMEATIKNMLTSLRAVTELQNPAIRDRHWKQLMQATKVS